MSKFYKKFVSVVGSKNFFWLIILVFLLESIWFALSAIYPMAFDEAYHLTNIQIYSHQFSPFFLTQPPGPLTYGPLIHNTSFLFHYLMSFPYRYIEGFTNNLPIQIIILRFIDIILLAAALFNFRKLLLKVKDEPALANLTILVFILVPIVPFLAGQINYDDLGILLTSISLLWTVRFVEQLRKKQQINLPLLIGAVSTAFFVSIVSYLFLPILAAIIIYLTYVLLRFAELEPKKLKRAILYSWHRIKPLRKFALFVVLLISISLFVESYGVNIVKFHNPIPQCNQLLSIPDCQTYSPWYRNYLDQKTYPPVDANPLRYTVSWIYGMYERTLFTINGPAGVEGYANPPPLLGISITVAVVFGGGVLLFIKYGRKILRNNPYLKFLLFVDLVFLISLWGRNYHDFIHLKSMIAINGRYLLPILIPIIFMIGLCYKELLHDHKNIMAAFTIVVFLGLLQGGGVISFINASDSNWYWPKYHYVNHINSAAQKIIKPVIIR